MGAFLQKIDVLAVFFFSKYPNRLKHPQIVMTVQEQHSREAKKARYRELLLSAINESLASILGEKSKELIFLYFRSVLFLEKESICNKPEVFDACLKILFGSGAINGRSVASLLEEAILKRLCSKLNLSYSPKNHFSASLREIRNHYLCCETAQSQRGAKIQFHISNELFLGKFYSFVQMMGI